MPVDRFLDVGLRAQTEFGQTDDGLGVVGRLGLLLDAPHPRGGGDSWGVRVGLVRRLVLVQHHGRLERLAAPVAREHLAVAVAAQVRLQRLPAHEAHAAQPAHVLLALR